MSAAVASVGRSKRIETKSDDREDIGVEANNEGR